MQAASRRKQKEPREVSHQLNDPQCDSKLDIRFVSAFDLEQSPVSGCVLVSTDVSEFGLLLADI